MVINYQDGEEIRELYASYTQSLNTGRFAEWVSCFTPDGVFESPWVCRHAGREALLELSRDSTLSAKFKLRHLTSDLIFAVDGDSGTGCCNLAFFLTRAGVIEYVGVGRYDDQLRKVDGKWYFAVRVEHLDTGKPSI
jgi:ketosteroid isomerase-like protein